MDPIQNPKQNKDKKPLEKAIQGNASIKKPSKSKRFLDSLINEDMGDVKEYLIFDVGIPAIKDMIVDMGQRALELLFYGRARGKNRNSNNSSYISYSSYNQQPRRNDNRPAQNRGKRIADLDSIEFESRGDAEHAVDVINELIDQYGEADVYDLYSIIGVTGNGFVDRNFGWRTKFQYDITYYRGMWVLHLPRVIELN